MQTQIAHVNSDRIPNNVHLSDDKRLQRALEQWQPNFLSWWRDMGPDGFQEKEIYLRTAVSVDAEGWAQFDYVKMPEYRWGIFLAAPVANRRIGFGDFMGEPAWQEVPGEFRNALRRLIVTQGDTEPASVEQQRQLGKTCPSLYDLRNLFQVNVEEGRHLWAMVYLLQTYFGRDGREEAEGMLMRRSGNPDKPRILSTFNEPIDDWLSFFMFTNFTDRDGKFQLLSLAESAFDPLSRTCRFMLTEEAHHLFVGQTGVQRIVRRACQLMNEHDTDDIRPFGGVPLAMIQKYINFWYSSSLDLFGSEVSSNAASYFASGLKGRAYEERKYTDHLALDGTVAHIHPEGGHLHEQLIPMRNAMNELLREEYIADNEKGLDKWNEEIAKHNIDVKLFLPSKRFHRTVGSYAGLPFTPKGDLVDQATWLAQFDGWMPNAADRAHVSSLMHQVIEPGKIAGWIAPPNKGINALPSEFVYARL